MPRFPAIAFVCLVAAGCARPAPPPAPPPADDRVRALADTYLAAYFERFPEQVTQFGVPGHRQDRLTDNSLAALKAWEAREDAWLRDVAQIDSATVAGAPLRATLAIVRESLEGSIATRVCRNKTARFQIRDRHEVPRRDGPGHLRRDSRSGRRAA